MAETLTTPVVSASLAAIAALVGLAVLARGKPRLAGTTLAAVWWWSAIALVAIAAAEILIAIVAGGAIESWVMPLRLAAAMSTLCPVMSLLGAKRPQDRGWQFVVATLWGILSLPGGRWLLFGGAEEIHPAQLGFLAILILVGAVNGIATRFWLSTVLFCGGQLALVAPFLPSAQAWVPGPIGPFAGLALIVAAFALRTAGIPPARSVRLPLDRVWLDFRDAFGTVWGLRVMERMNASAKMYGWPVSLGWSGFVNRDETQCDTELPPIIEDSLRTLLRRFVPPEWIDQRLAAGASPGEQPLTPCS